MTPLYKAVAEQIGLDTGALLLCPSCGLPKPRKEVVHAYNCRHSLGMETEIIPCEDCREEMRDAVALVGGLAVAR